MCLLPNLSGYDEREPIEVRISLEEIVIVNYPGPDRSVRLDQLRQGKAIPRRYRNRRIGDFLKELEITEGRSTGIPKILRAMKKNGSPPPVFDFDEDHSYFLIRLPVHRKEKTAQRQEEATTQVTMQVTTQVEALLRVMDGEQSREEIQRGLNLANREHFRKGYLVPALEAGLIERTIPTSLTAAFKNTVSPPRARLSSAIGNPGDHCRIPSLHSPHRQRKPLLGSNP